MVALRIDTSVLDVPAANLTPREQKVVEASGKLFVAYQRAQIRTEEAEASEAALVVSLQNVQQFMQGLPKKPKLADYKALVEQIGAEIEAALSEKGEEG